MFFGDFILCIIAVTLIIIAVGAFSGKPFVIKIQKEMSYQDKTEHPVQPVPDAVTQKEEKEDKERRDMVQAVQDVMLEVGEYGQID